MTKYIPCLAALCLAASALAQQAPAVVPISEILPRIPNGINTAAIPLAKFDWVERVGRENIGSAG